MRNNRAPLLLMEQMVMVAVFAMAAALCLQAFVLSDGDSRRTEARDHAVVLVQTAAETIRGCGSDEALSQAAEILGCSYDGGVLRMSYDEDWEPGGSRYWLTARSVSSAVPGLEIVRVAVEDGETVLFEVETAWQVEVGSHGE